jgi:hypothetical protein
VTVGMALLSWLLHEYGSVSEFFLNFHGRMKDFSRSMLSGFRDFRTLFSGFPEFMPAASCVAIRRLKTTDCYRYNL